MKSDVIETVLFLAFVLLLVFLFRGEPSVWDLLHERALEALQK